MYSIRPATLGDIAFLTEVVVAVTRAQGRLSADFNEQDYRLGFAEWTTEQLEGSATESTTSVIEVDGRDVGRLRVVRTDAAIELAGIQILPEAQSSGIGSRIIVSLIDEAVATSRPISLSVEADNPRARHLYQRLGFVETGRTHDEIGMTFVQALTP